MPVSITVSPQPNFENESIQTPTSLNPYVFNIGPYVIKNTGQQQILFNPTYSLKRVELSMQINVSAIKPICSPFLGTSYAGWYAWLHERTLTSSQQLKRDVTGILGTSLGILNSIDTWCSPKQYFFSTQLYPGPALDAINNCCNYKGR